MPRVMEDRAGARRSLRQWLGLTIAVAVTLALLALLPHPRGGCQEFQTFDGVERGFTVVRSIPCPPGVR